MPSDPEQAKAFLEYLKANKEKREILQKAFDDSVVSVGALLGFHFSATDLNFSLEKDVVGGGWGI